MNKVDYNIIKWIQDNLRNDFFNVIFKWITELGDAYFFIILAVFLYWTVNKKFAYKFLFAFIGSALTNALLKVIVQRPRPFDHELGGITSVGDKTHGYSFPSGHSQATGVIYYSIQSEYGKKSRLLRIVLLIFLIIVPFSRLYLAQHYLTDVVAGVILGMLASYLMFKLFDAMKDKEHIYPLFAIPVALVLMIVFANKDYGEYKDLFVAAGGFIGFAVGYALEKLYVKHEVNTTLDKKIYKLIIGILSIAIIYFGFKFLFPSNSLIFDGIRYMFVGLWASVGAPFIFTKVFKQQ